MAKYMTKHDLEVLQKAMSWIQERLPEDEMAVASPEGWVPVNIEIWNDEADATAGWIRWHGDGFWAIEPRVYDMPGSE